MKILFIGDIVGKASRKKIKEIIPTLKSKYNTDMIIANGENATSGYGLSKKDAEELFSSGIRSTYTWESCMGSKRYAFLY